MADDHDFGSLDASERPGLALDKLYSFLDSRGSGSHSYLLWFWQFADANQLLATTIQRLSDSVGAASANKAPSVIRPPRAPTVPTVPVSNAYKLLNAREKNDAEHSWCLANTCCCTPPTGPSDTDTKNKPPLATPSNETPGITYTSCLITS